MKERENIVISLGGSIIVPEEPDSKFINDFKNLILEWFSKEKNFFIVTGGGKTSRIYQEKLSQIVGNKKDVLDWMGIYSTQINAQFLRLAFDGMCHSDIIKNPSDVVDFKNNIVIISGCVPGFSTDMDAVLVAEKIGAKKIINLSNIPFVYDSDPKKNINAKKFEKMSWSEYRKIITDKWTPGMSVPFDPIASEKAESLNMEVIFIDGKDLLSLNNYLTSGNFIGTLIK